MSYEMAPAASRRQSRETALKLLYQWEMTGQDVMELVEAYPTEEDPPLTIDSFCEELVAGTVKHREAIDAEICRWSVHWSLKRMSAVDRNILRLAVYELLYRLDPSRPVSNASLEFTIFSPDGAYLGGVRLLYTNLEQDDTVDEWVREQGRRLIAQRLDMEWDFGLTVEQYAIDPTAFPWHPV